MLHRAGEVDVAGPRPVDVVEPLELRVLVDDLERQRAAERDALPETGEERDRVGFDALATAATVAPLAPAKLAVDRRRVDGEARGEAVDQGHEGGPVRFTGGPVAEHGWGGEERSGRGAPRNRV